MKYWRGYLTAVIFYLMAAAVNAFAEAHSALIDAVVPYMTRFLQGFLAEWTSGVSFCLWQVLLAVGIVLAVASLVVTIVVKWNPIQWFGWILAAVASVYFLFTCFWGMNYHAGPLAEDVRLEATEYTVSELARAAAYYRDEASRLAGQVKRNADGSVDFGTFEDMAGNAASGFQHLVYDEGYPVFAGSTLPVKKLGWDDYYTSVGITGITVALTGEAAVNPQIPAVSIPFTMCHEMSHRMSIAVERDANFAAYLASTGNDNIEYQYSGYYMAFRYCYITLASVDAAKASKVMTEASSLLKQDFISYDEFFRAKEDKKATQIADKANDTYLKASGDSDGVASYGNVTDLLVCWYLEKIEYEPPVEETPLFDPFDENQVDISDIPNAGSFGG